VPNGLQSFVGTWETEGQQYESPLGPAAKVKALETYEWLTGRAFLVHRFEGHVGDKPAARVELIGAAEAGASFPVHSFYDNGFVGEWQLQVRGASWILNGHWPVRGKELKVRCTIIDGGDTMTGRWEYAEDGDDWKPSWDVKSVRKRS
jgi:uncharacterized protein DUF1579